MNFDSLLTTVKDTVTVKRVFAEPYVQDGLTVIPAAVVRGGGGGGTGYDEKGQENEGGGLGVSSRPAGAYVIKGGDVIWRPAVDPTRIMTVIGLVVAVFLLTRPRTLRAKAKLAGTSTE